MYSCLILSQPKDKNRKKEVNDIIQTSLKEFPYEKKQKKDKLYLIIKNATYDIGWQTTLNLECAGFSVLYGFGDSEEDAKKNALQKILEMQRGY